jgi:demethylmenaquinone methyltransferase/2-methoxy-6-polyprenyl-1,4-benzoquinol methylase
MHAPAVRSSSPADAPIAPHPALPRYYDQAPDGKRKFIRRIFDRGAGDYDRIENLMALGYGPWYRRQALARAGLTAGMTVLDVATGTGLVAREEMALTGDAATILGLDPSVGMISQARRALPIRAVLGIAEDLPLADGAFDFLSMGYALRHLSDLSITFREFHRVLKPGGRVCILEITRPRKTVHLALLKAYARVIVPAFTRVASHHADSRLLWRYYWDTIEACVPAETVTSALAGAGFRDVAHRLELGLFSEYTATR